MSSSLILVPARFGSSRFEGKPLAKILNKPMIEYVVENCIQTGFDYAVVTDNDKIEDFLNSINAKVVRVDDDVPSGSERIALAYERYFKGKGYKHIINLQGDEPLMDSESIKKVVKGHASSEYDIFTATKKHIENIAGFTNPNIVKAVKSDITGNCFYFSRSPVPFHRDTDNQKNIKWFQHIGIYSFTVKALNQFVSDPESYLESTEKLEQLRALEEGLSIGCVDLDVNLLGVDTPQDIKKVEGVLSEQKS